MSGDVVVQVGKARLAGRLIVPDRTTGVVIFAHGSGSGRHSPRTRYLADVLHRAGLGTLLFDLLTAEEAPDRAKVFDVALLAGRLAQVISWLDGAQAKPGLPVGLFGSGTGAAAALSAAAQPGIEVAAVVSRGGRPDLAGSCLAEVRAPTLLIVGALDYMVLNRNRAAEGRLRCPHELVVVPGATHLFEEPGALQAAAALTAHWFLDHVGGAGAVRERREASHG